MAFELKTAEKKVSEKAVLGDSGFHWCLVRRDQTTALSHEVNVFIHVQSFWAVRKGVPCGCAAPAQEDAEKAAWDKVDDLKSSQSLDKVGLRRPASLKFWTSELLNIS